MRASYDRLQIPQRVQVNTRGSSKAKETNGEPTENRVGDSGDGETSMSAATEMMEMVPTPVLVNDQLTAGTATENPGKSTWTTKETCGVEKVLKTDDVTGNDVILEIDFQDAVITKSYRESESKIQNTGGNGRIVGGPSNRDNGLRDSNVDESNQMGQVEGHNPAANQPMGTREVINPGLNTGKQNKEITYSKKPKATNKENTTLDPKQSAYQNEQKGNAEEGLLGRKKDGASRRAMENGRWKRLQRDPSNNMGMEEHSEKEGPKRKTLGVLDQNIPQGKRLKSETNEVCMVETFKQHLISAEVAQQPRRDQ